MFLDADSILELDSIGDEEVTAFEEGLEEGGLKEHFNEISKRRKRIIVALKKAEGRQLSDLKRQENQHPRTADERIVDVRDTVQFLLIFDPEFKRRWEGGR